MNSKIVVASLIMSIIAFTYIMTYPTTNSELPYVPTATLTCGGTTLTTSFSHPTSESSNAILGPGYTYYYSNIIVINSTTCTVNGKVTIYRKHQ